MDKNRKSRKTRKRIEDLQKKADFFLKKLEDKEVKQELTQVLQPSMNPRATSIFNDLVNEWSRETSGTNMEHSEILSKLAKLKQEPKDSESVQKKKSPASETPMETAAPCLPKEMDTLEAKLERMERREPVSTESNNGNARRAKKRGPDKHWDKLMSAVGAEPLLEDDEFQASKMVKISSSNMDIVSIETSPRSVYQSPGSSRNVSPWGSECNKDDEMVTPAFRVPQKSKKSTYQFQASKMAKISPANMDIVSIETSPRNVYQAPGSSRNVSPLDSECNKDNEMVTPPFRLRRRSRKITYKSETSSGYMGDSESNIDSDTAEVNSMANDLQVPNDFLSIFRDFAISIKNHSDKAESIPEEKKEKEASMSKKSTGTTPTTANEDIRRAMESNPESNGLIPERVHGNNINCPNTYVKTSYMHIKREYGEVTSSNGQSSASSKKQKLTYDHWIPDHAVSSVQCTSQRATWDQVMRETGTRPISPNFYNFATNLVFRKPTNETMSFKRKRPSADNP